MNFVNRIDQEIHDCVLLSDILGASIRIAEAIERSNLNENDKTLNKSHLESVAKKRYITIANMMFKAIKTSSLFHLSKTYKVMINKMVELGYLDYRDLIFTEIELAWEVQGTKERELSLVKELSKRLK